MRQFLILIATFVLSFSSYSQSLTDTLAIISGKYGWGIELGPCTGGCYSTKESAEYIKNGCFGSASLAMSYGRLTHMVRLAGISSSIKNNIPNNIEWVKENRINSMNIELLTGYKILKSKRLDFSPYFGIYTSRFNTKQNKDILDKSHRFYNITMGTMTKLKFGLLKKENPYRSVLLKEDIYYWYIKLYAGYYPGFFTELELDGSELFWNLSIGVSFRNVEIFKKD